MKQSTTNHAAFAPEWVYERLGRALRPSEHTTAADGIEASFRGDVVDQMRLGDTAIVQAASVDVGMITVRAVVDGRQGIAQTSDLGDAAIEECVADAVQQAIRAPKGGERIVLPGPSPLEEAPDWALDPEVLSLSTAEKAAWLASTFDAHDRDGFALAGRFNSGRTVSSVRSTTGVEAYHQGSFADLSLSSLQRPAGHRASSTRGLLDARITRERVEAMAEEVRAECHRAHDPMVIEPGKWDVVLSPVALAEIMSWLSYIGFSSKSLEDGTSFAAGRIDEKITGDVVSITDDGQMGLGIGVPIPFDAEGQARQKIELLREGVAKSFVHNTTSGARAGCSSTGHGQHYGLFSPGGAAAAHMHFAAGESSLDELIGQVERGLYVTRLHYVNGMIEPRRAVMTGLLRDAAFMIEDGRLTRPVTTLRFTDSILEAFERIPGARGVGREMQALPGSFGWTETTVCPPVLVPQLRFTSGR